MFISVLCLSLLACLHSAVGAPVRLATYEPSEAPSNFWTQKQRPEDHSLCGDHWTRAVDPYTAVVVTRARDCPSVMVAGEEDCPSTVYATTSFYSKAAGEEIDDDGDTDNSTQKFLPIILIAIFFLALSCF